MRDFQLPGRSPVYGTRGAAATSHPAATLTALDVLRSGGNAMDAAVAAAAVQCVVEPQSTGIGGDCFVLYAPAGSEHVLAYNGSGRAPSAAHVDWFLAQDIHTIDRHSPHAVTIPGAVDTWCRLIQDHGRKELADLLHPAIDYAERGYIVHPRVSFDWHSAVDTLERHPVARKTFLPNGRPLNSGDRHAQPQLAQTLNVIAQQGRDGFYTGAIAQDIVETLQQLGGRHTLDDMAEARGEYVAPISTEYGGYQVWECPPNGQGITVLIMLNILNEVDLKQYAPDSLERVHLSIEAARIAYRDRDVYVADPLHASIPIEQLLSKAYAARVRQHMSLDQAMTTLPPPAFPEHPDTVYISVVDDEGNAVSFIQSIYHSFGSGIVTPKTGILLQSRGSGFRVDPHHWNCIAPRKRPIHTIIPGMLMHEHRAVMPFGVMGAAYQPAGQTHLLTNMLTYGMDIQAALDYPRFFYQDNHCCLERGIAPAIAQGLQQLGHRTAIADEPLGGGQAIWIDWQNGTLVAGSDPRKDGCALAY
ncbi:MAG: gamma-glutamyltransferase [Cyanobacteria bacterium P01_A01_bin.37]